MGNQVFSRTVSAGRRSSRARSLERKSSKTLHDDDDPEYSGLRRPGDYKKRQIFKGRQLFFLAYQSIGVIYGDIGTSPLYVYSSTFTSGPPTRDNLIGVLSLIIWSLLAYPTLKYCFIVLRADNEGEGGTFSCYSLLSRYARITDRDPKEEPLIKLERYRTEDLHASNLHVRNTIEKSKFVKILLKAIGVFAVSMVMSDGVLTPAQSVLGAVQGLNVIVPNINHATILGTTCGILVLLFVVQPFGTTKIGVTFAPIVIVWLGMLAAFGIYNLALYDWRVLKAFNPGEAFLYLIRNKTEGWRSLGGILLAFTGVEALFADLGAFSMRAIQISWLSWCLPCLLLAYIGQAAYISVHPEAYAYPVFHTCPPHMLIPIMVVAVLAAIVASQAIITATFQLLAQIIKLSYFPPLQVIHTSKVFHSQLYVPIANYLLCIGTVIISAVFKNTTALGQAYGVCVMFVTLFDTTMTALTALIVWRIRPYLVALPWLIIALMDGVFISSALTKVPSGAWFTLTLATILALIFLLWRFGKENQWKAEAEDRHVLSKFIDKDGDGTLRLAGPKGGEPLSVIKGLGIFFDKGGIKTPQVFSQYISKFVCLPEVMIFFHMRPLEYPTVPSEDRFVVSKIRYLPNCYRIVLRYGFMDEVITPDLASLIHRHLREYIVMEKGPRAAEKVMPAPVLTKHGSELENGPALEIEKDQSDEQSIQQYQEETLDVAQLEQAYKHRVLYIIGKEEMLVRRGTPLWRGMLLKMFLVLREHSRSKMANTKVPTERLVEIGFLKEV